MISIGLYDNLPLRLNSYGHLLKTFEKIKVVFRASNSTQLTNYLEGAVPDILILLSSKPDKSFKKTLSNVEQYKLNKIIITTEVSMWLISNFKSLNILGYLVMSAKPSSLEDAIYRVSQGKTYCCNEVSSAILNLSDNLEFTIREREIIELLIDDKSTKEIAEELFVSTHTVSSYRKMILNKFQVKSTTGMVKKAIEAGIV